MYPGTSVAEFPTPNSAASARLLAAEEGSVGVSAGNGEADPDPPMGEFLGEPYTGEAHPPLPRHRHNLQANRDLQSQDQPPYVGGDGLYSGDEQFSYEGIPYHRSINPGWYDPSGRGSDIHYGAYHPQFILPPPFPPHRFPAWGYANDPTIHWPHSARGPGHHAHAPLPFRGARNAEYANASGSRKPLVSAHRQAQAYNLMPSDGGMLLGTRGGPEYSARTSPDAILEPSRPARG
ncbi:hypothetical protein PISMIDRAFT_19203 [Pisolithus microcarpus 441]|uniref:Uncharacterized protein n=1 Tax=Pisolithus microcarpus 441 TaxID=765257 RepID=A0A0C9YV85_9AGAM|nr:hypothetical protein BKA83DRAFT_19203 [Pisolithus microcarpus]KIK11813.1 hypothetical protein PISMIDRAFT_19203 [Pisolithus microcarpus 441]